MTDIEREFPYGGDYPQAIETIRKARAEITKLRAETGEVAWLETERDEAMALVRRAEPLLRDYGRLLSNRYTGDHHPTVVDWLTDASALLAGQAPVERSE